MTITIEGRNRFADDAPCTVSIYRYKGEDPVLVIEGATIDQHGDGKFIISAKHKTAVDVEHDSSYAAMLEGGGLSLDYMDLAGVNFNGAIFKAQYYAEMPKDEDLEQCDGGEWCSVGHPHPYLKFTPPKQEWKPAMYWIQVRFR